MGSPWGTGSSGRRRLLSKVNHPARVVSFSHLIKRSVVGWCASQLGVKVNSRVP
jgi:hypothetical protein